MVYLSNTVQPKGTLMWYVLRNEVEEALKMFFSVIQSSCLCSAEALRCIVRTPQFVTFSSLDSQVLQQHLWCWVA